MVALFKDRSPSNVIWLIVLSIAVHGHFYFIPPQVIAQEQDGLISAFLARYISTLPSIVLIVFYHLLVLIQALRLNFLFNDQRMFIRSNFLTAMVYVLLTAILHEWNHLSPALIINTLLIWLFAKIVRLYNHSNPKTLLFNIGLITGVSVLLYHPTALLILVTMFALLVVRPFKVTEWLVLAMGILAPFYFFGAYLFLTDQFHLFYRNLPQWSLNLPHTQNIVMLFITAAVILLMLIIGMFHWQDRSRRLLIHVRKNWGVLFVMLLVMLPLPFINKNANLDSLLLWAIPVSPFIAEGFLGPKKNIVPTIMFWSMVLLIVINNWILFKK